LDGGGDVAHPLTSAMRVANAKLLIFKIIAPSVV
jgi:hypothetical protein